MLLRQPTKTLGTPRLFPKAAPTNGFSHKISTELMKDRKSRSIPICIFEYVTTLVLGSLIAAAIMRNSYGGGSFALVFVLPISWGCLIIFYTLHYFWRFFRDEFGGYLLRSLGLAIFSTILSVPLSLFFIKNFWPPFNGGPGP